VQAALYSASTFALGAALPLLVAYFSSQANTVLYVGFMSLIFLAILGGLAANAGGANMWKGASRVAFWGALAMAATASVGSLFGVVTA
jgi:vacuolar iron transporter family protein